MRNTKSTKQRGAVSLFIVMFTALLLTVITVSFVQLMVKDQQQATYSDLSESAYDSAMAGVEDAKRALLIRLECGNKTTAECNRVNDAINSGQCTTLSEAFGGSATDGETAIQQNNSSSDRKLDQAYTCVKITPNTTDFLGKIDSSEMATLVPLRSTAPFNTVVVKWHQREGGGAVNRTSSTSLPAAEAWPVNRPALLRAQLINGKNSFLLSDFDTSGYSDTLFLFPSSSAAGATRELPLNFALDTRRGGAQPHPVICKPMVASGDYACEVAITIDTDPDTMIPAGSQTAFLNLIAFYNATDYQIELVNSKDPGPILFDGVQPEVDSTGRANDLFRRVVSRVELNNTFRYPVSALETEGNLCKNFTVTTDPSNYSNTCAP